MQPWTDAPAERFAPGTMLSTEPPAAGPLQVVAASSASGRLVVHFDGVDGRPAAEALRGVSLFVAAEQRPVLDDPDEYYDTDLVGLEARLVDGAVLGPVVDVVHAGAATYLVVRMDGRDRLVPFVAAIVVSVQVPDGVVAIDPPEGLFEL